MTTCTKCACVKAALGEVGMDPERVFCNPPDNCSIGCGYGTEGLPLDEVERLVDQAIAVCADANRCPGCGSTIPKVHKWPPRPECRPSASNGSTGAPS